TPKGLELLMGTDAKAVHTHQRQPLWAMLKYMTRGQLGQGGGFAHAGRTDQSYQTAFFDHFLLGNANGMRQVRQQKTPGLTWVVDPRHTLQHLTAQLRRQPQALQAP